MSGEVVWKDDGQTNFEYEDESLIFDAKNKDWEATNVWYKNCPVGLNQISKWTRLGAENVGTDTKKARVTTHSNRFSAVSVLACSDPNLQEVIKVTGHSL